MRKNYRNRWSGYHYRKFEKEIENLKNGILKVKDKENLLDLEFNDIEWKKGRDGVPYVTFNNGSINYFPNARYGAFIKKSNIKIF